MTDQAAELLGAQAEAYLRGEDLKMRLYTFLRDELTPLVDLAGAVGADPVDEVIRPVAGLLRHIAEVLDATDWLEADPPP